MTQEEKRALIATEVMGWTLHRDGKWWVDQHGSDRIEVGNFRPDELRDQLAEVEAALTEEQRTAYFKIMTKDIKRCSWWDCRTAPPAVCVDALVEMLSETPSKEV